MDIRREVTISGRWCLSYMEGYTEEDMFWARVDQACVITGWDKARMRTPEFWDWFLRAWHQIDLEVIEFAMSENFGSNSMDWEGYLLRHFNHHSKIFL